MKEVDIVAKMILDSSNGAPEITFGSQEKDCTTKWQLERYMTEIGTEIMYGFPWGFDLDGAWETYKAARPDLTFEEDMDE